MARGKAMEKIRVKRKADQLIISHKLGKDEQLNAVELDIISRGEIPTLTPVQVVSSVLGTELRFLIPNAVPLTERISGDLSFDVFCGLVLGIVETVQSCDSHGIRGSNLELRPEYIFCGAGDGSLRLLYWPLISIAEYANTRNVLKKCGERYRCAPEDASYRDAYLAYFDSRLKFDVFHFEHSIQSLFGINLDEGTLRAHTEAAYLVEIDFVAQTHFCDEALEFGLDFIGVRGQTAGTAANQDVTLAVGTLKFLVQTRGTLRRFLFQICKGLNHAFASLLLYSLMMSGTALTATLG